MDDKHYFKLANQLTFATVMADRARILRLLQSANTESIFYCDLSAVNECDSAGLALLVDMRRLCRKQKATLVIQHTPEQISALATLYGVEQIFYDK